VRDRRRLALAAALALLVAVVVGAVLARDTGPAAPVSSAGRGDGLALRGIDVLTGKEVALADFAGKPVVVNIWASWCPGCNAEAAALARFAEAHPEAGFLGIDFQDSRNAAREFYERYGWEFPSIFDPDGALARRLGLRGTPTTIFVNEHRIVVGVLRGNALSKEPDAPVADVMELGPSTLRPNSPIEALLQSRANESIKNWVVTTSHGVLLGLLPRADAERAVGETESQSAA
jgi:thiol-disulfide isomerase/thioredoxin